MQQGREKDRILGESVVELSVVYWLGKAVKQLGSWEEMVITIWIGWEEDGIGTKLGCGVMRIGEVVLQLQGRTVWGKALVNCQCVSLSTREGAFDLMEIEGGGKGRGLLEK